MVSGRKGKRRTNEKKIPTNTPPHTVGTHRSWEIYRCGIDCADHPNDCISETLYKQQADAYVPKSYFHSAVCARCVCGLHDVNAHHCCCRLANYHCGCIVATVFLHPHLLCGVFHRQHKPLYPLSKNIEQTAWWRKASTLWATTASTWTIAGRKRFRLGTL